jgi:hypothetical protein
VRRECVAFLFVLADLANMAAARTYISCRIREVNIISGPGEGKSSAHEKDMSFWLDEHIEDYCVRR